MALKAFNSVGGISVGETPSTIILSNRDITGTIANFTGNVTAPYFIGNVVGNVSGNLTVAGPNTGIVFNDAGSANSVSAFTFDKTTNVVTNTGNTVSGNFLTAGTIIGSTLQSNVATGTAPLLISSTTLVTNLNADLLDGYNTATANTGSTIAVRDANGNISANFFIGNGSQLTGLSTSSISNGTSNVSIPAAGGNINLYAGGIQTLVVTSTGANITGTLNTGTGNANLGNLGTNGLITAVGNVSGGNLNTGGILNVTGTGVSTISGNLSMATKNITNLATPGLASDAATKQYVDDLVSTGLYYHAAVNAATTGTLETATGGTITYNTPNGSANGVGAFLSTTGTYLLIDTVNVQTAGTRILVKNQANAALNGVYTYTNTTAITRSLDTDTYGPGAEDLSENDYFFVSSGNVNIGSSYVCNTAGTITFGTTNINFALFSTSQVYSNGVGLSLSGTQFFITNTAVTTGTYGSGDRVGTFTVNQQGQLTSAANTVIAANAANLTGTTLASTINSSNLTSLGTLTSLSVTGNANVGNIGAAAGIFTSVNASGNITGDQVTANTTAFIGTTAIRTATVTTSAITANQTISTIPYSGVTGVEWLIRGVDSAGSKYSVATVHAVTNGAGSVDYTVYGTVNLGSSTGTLAVNIVASNIALQVTPASTNSTVWTTQYRTV